MSALILITKFRKTQLWVGRSTRAASHWLLLYLCKALIATTREVFLNLIQKTILVGCAIICWHLNGMNVSQVITMGGSEMRQTQHEGWCLMLFLLFKSAKERTMEA